MNANYSRCYPYLLFVFLIVFDGPFFSCLLSQSNFIFDFKHGENDKYFGRIQYSIYLSVDGEEYTTDSKQIQISPLNPGIASVTILINGVDLAYKSKDFHSKSQDKEVDAFVVQFDQPSQPSGGKLDFMAVEKIYDRSVSIGSTKNKVAYSFNTNIKSVSQGSISLSFKVLFSPRGRSPVTDSRSYQISIPITINTPESIFQNQIAFEKTMNYCSLLEKEIISDPKRKNLQLAEKIKSFLNQVKGVKHDRFSELEEVLKQYENRSLGPEDVYEKIIKFKNAGLLNKANSDINLYINNCIQGIWSDCREIENVRYFELTLAKNDTTLIRGFLQTFPNSNYYDEIYNKLLSLRKSGNGSGSSYSSYSNSRNYQDYGSYSPDFSNNHSETNEEFSADESSVTLEPANAIIEYKEALRRITIEKTGNWQNISYYYELIGNMGRLGKKILSLSKRDVIYIDDIDAASGTYRVEFFKKSSDDSYELIHDSISIEVIKESGIKKKIFIGISIFILGLSYLAYLKFFKI
jgi:hypothetical protein